MCMQYENRPLLCVKRGLSTCLWNMNNENLFQNPSTKNVITWNEKYSTIRSCRVQKRKHEKTSVAHRAHCNSNAHSNPSRGCAVQYSTNMQSHSSVQHIYEYAYVMDILRLCFVFQYFFAIIWINDIAFAWKTEDTHTGRDRGEGLMNAILRPWLSLWLCPCVCVCLGCITSMRVSACGRMYFSYSYIPFLWHRK